ncbi:uncharacterized protein ARMOST_17949 [Armillaria ostoyae]|uniref:Uncharacterized protein n=1 Tax=Armillaria ostoyae TaxID=47428 RepID=A0A284S0F3_ARMOS|nr:uncharacterized protein ARMOST_17949 [Armillaria ostoyae]
MSILNIQGQGEPHALTSMRILYSTNTGYESLLRRNQALEPDGMVKKSASDTLPPAPINTTLWKEDSRNYCGRYVSMIGWDGTAAGSINHLPKY